MQLNALFPTRDIGGDPAKIRDWAQAAEDLGFAYIEVPDHVFGAKGRDGWTPLYDETDPFHETFTTLTFLAAVTKTPKDDELLGKFYKAIELLALNVGKAKMLPPNKE